MHKDIKCGECHWWKGGEILDGKMDGDSDWGGCHKNAPTIIHGIGTGVINQRFPQMHRNDGCGDQWFSPDLKE